MSSPERITETKNSPGKLHCRQLWAWGWPRNSEGASWGQCGDAGKTVPSVLDFQWVSFRQAQPFGVLDIVPKCALNEFE